MTCHGHKPYCSQPISFPFSLVYIQWEILVQAKYIRNDFIRISKDVKLGDRGEMRDLQERLRRVASTSGRVTRRSINRKSSPINEDLL